MNKLTIVLLAAVMTAPFIGRLYSSSLKRCEFYETIIAIDAGSQDKRVDKLESALLSGNETERKELEKMITKGSDNLAKLESQLQTRTCKTIAALTNSDFLAKHEIWKGESMRKIDRLNYERQRLQQQARTSPEEASRAEAEPLPAEIIYRKTQAKKETSTLSFDERLATCFDTDLILSGAFATDNRSDITFSEFKNRAQYQLLGGRTESYKHIHSDGKIYEMTSIDGGEPSNCFKTAELDQEVDSCTPESPGGICKGIHYLQGNALVQLSCTPSGPISENNPACQKRIVGYLFR